MAGTLERFDAAAEGYRRRLAGIALDDVGLPSPCEGWRARELIDHTVEVLVMVTNLVSPPFVDDTSASDLARFDAAAADLHAKIADPALGATVVESPFGAMALKQLVSSIVVHDLVVHTWDLARTSGGDEQLDADLVAHTYAAMLPFDEALREHGFAAKVPADEDADTQTKLLCFLGRRP
jgi:uncharacterized protein (TIGR03086 family)